MPAYTMPGLMTGQNTNDIIQKLVELEKKPARRWETDNEYAKLQIQAWNELKNQTTLLQTRTRALTSFTAPFSTKSVKSSVEGVITGEASRAAKSGEKSIEVLELASKHQISGNPVDSLLVLPNGEFAIYLGKSKEVIKFAGGNLTELLSSIRNNASSLVVPSLVKIDKDSSVISLLSQKTGKSQKLFFEDPNGILAEAGIVKKSLSSEILPPKTIEIGNFPSELHPDKKYKENANPDKSPVVSERGIELHADTAYQFPINPESIGERQSIQIELEGETVPSWEVGVKIEKDGAVRTRMVTLSPVGSVFTLPVSDFATDKQVTKIIFTNPHSKSLFIKRVILQTEVIPGDAEPILVLQEPKDAKIRIDGVEITRETNEAITDVLEGISFNLHKTTTEPVTLKIQTDSLKGTTLIKEWVESYNSLMKFSKELTSVEKDGRLSERKAVDATKNEDISKDYWDAKSKSGLLSGDNAVLRLIAGMKTAANSYYPTKGYKVLTDIGISTGAIGSNWNKIQDGLLVIDEEALKNAVGDNPDGVRELFATDANGDGRMEDGLGTRLLDHLKPYTQFPIGIISGKTKYLEENISQNNKRIKEHEAHLVGYESKLKQRFLYMEQGVGKNKSVGNYLQNNLFRNNNQE